MCIRSLDPKIERANLGSDVYAMLCSGLYVMQLTLKNKNNDAETLCL